MRVLLTANDHTYTVVKNVSFWNFPSSASSPVQTIDDGLLAYDQFVAGRTYTRNTAEIKRAFISAVQLLTGTYFVGGCADTFVEFADPVS